MATQPVPGDLILRGSFGTGFELVDAVTHTVKVSNLPTVESALKAAMRLQPNCVWQQNVDERGRPIGELFRLPFRLSEAS
jgi:hypothetical protein